MNTMHRIAAVLVVVMSMAASGGHTAVTRGIENATQPIRMSADGRYVVYALRDAPPLDVAPPRIEFLDRMTGAVTVVAPVRVGPLGFTEPGDTGYYKGLAISANGRVVAFANGNTTLVTPDANGNVWDIFVRDMDTGVLSRVSVSSTGVQANDYSALPALSGDGRYVAFSSDASNLVPGDTNGRLDVFVHDRVTGATERVNVASDGSQSAGDISTINDGPPLFFCHCPAISDDGRYVAFWSLASDLVANDTNMNFDVFVHDRQTGATTRASVKSDGSESHPFLGPVHLGMSGDGRYVGFESRTNDLDPRKTSPHTVQGVFVHDRVTGITELASMNSAGESANDLASGDPAFSYDGRYLTFQSTGTNLVPDDTNDRVDVFLRDRLLGTTERVNVTSAGGQAGGTIETLYQVSNDGRFVAFQSSVVLDLDPDRYGDGYVRDRTCANGVLDPGEACDDGNLVETDACDTRCLVTGCPPSVCGDGVVEGCEQCDDGNAVTGDCCSASCTWQGRNSACTADTNQCTTDACDGAGTCVHVPFVNGAYCNDGLFCNGQDYCNGDACTIHFASPCPSPTECAIGCDETLDQCVVNPIGTPCSADANPCSLDQCNGSGQCTHPPAPEDTPCPDDGLACTDDVCDDAAACTHLPGPDGTPCDDGNACTTSDACTAGECDGAPFTCPLCEICDPTGGCHAAPRSDCRHPTAPAKASISIRDSALDQGDRFHWKWTRGDATQVTELGDPLATDAYALCGYDPGGLVFRLQAPAGGQCGNASCWKPIGAAPPRGFKYRDRERTPDGIDRLTLTAGSAGRSKTVLRGKGEHLPMPALGTLQMPLTVQLQGTPGVCFEATFTAVGVQTTTAERFRARSE